MLVKIQISFHGSRREDLSEEALDSGRPVTFRRTEAGGSLVLQYEAADSE